MAIRPMPARRPGPYARRMTTPSRPRGWSAALRAAWREPQAEAPPRAPWWDQVLAFTLVVASVAEGLLRDDVPWPVYTTGLAVVTALALLWRTRRPLVALVAAFGAQTLAGVLPALAGEPYGVLYTTSVVLLFGYSLARWASGRAVLVGVLVLVAGHFGREPLYGSTGVDNVIGVGALLFPVALGAAVRFWGSARTRALEQVRLRERSELARELHDTVAHHVSAIVIQAQAGQAVAAADPERALGVLGTVEQTATQALAEMRAMVGVLRDGGPAEHDPGHVLADLARLAGADGEGPVVVVELPDELEVSAPVGQALFRVAQESVTNARWHARSATRVAVRVAGDEHEIRLEVTDDGTGSSARGRGSGYGIVGMTERVEALGGRLAAGPRSGGGWAVTATLPREVGR